MRLTVLRIFHLTSAMVLKHYSTAAAAVGVFRIRVPQRASGRVGGKHALGDRLDPEMDMHSYGAEEAA